MTQPAADLSPTAREAIADALNQCVAETAVVTMMAQNFHWNVTGMAFGPLHDLFQQIYEDHFVAQDDLAERIKALEAHAEGTLAGMVARSKIAEHDGHADDKTMIAALRDAQVAVAATLASAWGVGSTARRHADRRSVHRARPDPREIRLDASGIARVITGPPKPAS